MSDVSDCGLDLKPMILSMLTRIHLRPENPLLSVFGGASFSKIVSTQKESASDSPVPGTIGSVSCVLSNRQELR